MGKSEPTLAPEWLKSSGSVSGSGNATHNVASSSSHSDEQVVAPPTRNRSSVSFSDYGTLRSPASSDRSSSSYFRRSSSSNGSTMHDKGPSTYLRSNTSLGRSHRKRDWEKDAFDFREKEKSVLRDHWDSDYHDPLANIPTSRAGKDTLRRSQSMLSGKRDEVSPRRVAADSNNWNNGNHYIGNGPLTGGRIVSSIRKTAFERDFPSLGAEERQGAPDVGRAPSPGLSTAVQSTVIGTSTVIGGDGWTSALAEVPIIVGSNNMGISSGQQTIPACSAPAASSTMTGLNMAETLAQAPSRASTTPLLSVETQRLEELAIKQSRQLIPMTHSTPKASVLNPSDKMKPKTAVRTGDMSMATKIGQQQLSSSHLVKHSLRGGAVRFDVPKTSNVGKLHILKLTREKIGASPTTANDGSSPTNTNKVVNSPFTVPPSAAFVPLRSPNHPKLANAECKAATHGSSVEKRPTTSQAQSRNDFFNLVRRKTSTTLSSAVPDPSSVLSAPILEKKSGELIEEVAAAPVSPQCSDTPSSDPSGVDWSTENGGDMNSNGDACDEECHSLSNNGEERFISDAVIYPDEKEAAFLRSLGWEENAGDEGGLTEEEINGFYQEYRKPNPSLKLCRGTQPKLSMPHVGSLGGASSELSSSSDSESET